MARVDRPSLWACSASDCQAAPVSKCAVRIGRPGAFASGSSGRPVEGEARFGGLLRALRCGAPPHGGLAPGLDRMLMLLADEPNLRAITPFPFLAPALSAAAVERHQNTLSPAVYVSSKRC